MLIVILKCLSTFSSQVILNHVHYHKIILASSSLAISCKSVTVATRQQDLSFACFTSELRPIFRCARSFSTLQVQVVLWRYCGLFHAAAVSLLSPEKLSDNHPLRGTTAAWPNKYNWFKWVMSSEKKMAWNHTCWCKLQSFLNSVPFSNNNVLTAF